MPRKKKIKLSESYVSLVLGLLVVLAVSIFVIVFAKNKTYDKINTAISTFQQPQGETQNKESESNFYEVKSGDNLWTIAENVYGSGYNWVDLAKENRLENPGLIFAGNKLVLPKVRKITVETKTSKIANLDPAKSITGSSYKVQQGDDLWDIAVRKYGDGYKWPEIARVNEIPNPDLIYANTVLKLP